MRPAMVAATMVMLSACGNAPQSSQAELASPTTTAAARLLPLAAAPGYVAKDTDLGNQSAMSCADPVVLEQLRAELKWRGGGFSDAEINDGAPEWKDWFDRSTKAGCFPLKIYGETNPVRYYVDYFERVHWSECPDGGTCLQGDDVVARVRSRVPFGGGRYNDLYRYADASDLQPIAGQAQ